MCKSKTTEKVHTRVFRIFFIHSCCLLLSFFFVDNPPIEATFRGTEYVTYDLSQKSLEPILSINDQISLYFKTRKSSGLLFYTGNTSKLKSLHLKGLEGEREKKATERLLYSMQCLSIETCSSSSSRGSITGIYLGNVTSKRRL